MEVRCDKCQARYRVDDSRIGPQGLTMRCGKCQNTFKVTRAPAQPPPAAAPQAPAPAAPKPDAPTGGSTMIFAAPQVAPRPPPRPASATPPAADEAAGRTMMFPSAPVRPPAADESAGRTMMFPGPPAPAPSRPATAPDPSASGTIVFSQPPARPAPAKPAPGSATKPPLPKAPPAAGTATQPDAPRSTMLFGGAPAAANAAPPAPPAPEPQPTLPARTEEAAPAGAEDVSAETAESEAGEEAARPPGPFDKAPPRGLLIGVATGLVLLLLIGGGLVAYRKLSRHPAPPAAVEMLTSAQAEAAQDTLASLASAETKARDSLEVAGSRARFPEAVAALGTIRIQWADALADEAAAIADRNADDPRAAQLQAEAKAKLKSAFEVLSPAAKADKDAPELQLALADYYRAQRSPSNMNRYLKPFKDDPRAALIQGMALQQEDEGAEGAIPRLKAALAADPRSARVHFRLALACAAAKDAAKALAEVNETLRLSPQHERARALRERLGKPGAAEEK